MGPESRRSPDAVAAPLSARPHPLTPPRRRSAGGRVAGFGLLLSCLLLSGCYSTRTQLPEHARSIAVPVFANKTYCEDYARKVEVEVTEAARKTFLQTGQLKIAGRESADLILEGTILKHERRALRVDRYGEPAETQMRILAQISLYDVKDAKYLFQNAVVANDDDKYESGAYNLRRGEDESLGRQKATEDLGRAIARRVLDHW